MPATAAKGFLSACFAAAVFFVSPSAVLAQQASEPAKDATPTEVLSLLRESPRVESGQAFFEGADFVGSTACASCHAAEHADWQETWHAKMERYPSPDIIVGDFDDRTVTYKNVKVKDGEEEKKITYQVRAFREGDDFFFTVIDQDDAENDQTYKIGKVLGGKWDQHYEVKIGENYLPTPLRWNVTNDDWLSTSYRPFDWVKWDGTADGRPRTPSELPKNRFAEQKCANCHTTGYTYKKDKEAGVWMATGNGELGIACEKCHGPGSLHVAQAEAAQASGEALAPASSTIVHPTKDLDAHQQTQVCAQCHGRSTNKTVKDVAFPLTFLPGDRNITAHLRFWSYSGTSKKSEYKYFWANDWAKRNRQQWQDFTKSAHYTKAGMSCLTCHTFHGNQEDAQLRMTAEAICVDCHSSGGEAKRPNVEMFEGSPMQAAGVTCVNCHMAKIGYRSNKTADKAHPWDTASHNFIVPTPKLMKTDGVRSACVFCHTEGEGMLANVNEDAELLAFSLDDLDALLRGHQETTRAAIDEVQAVLASVTSEDPETAALVERAEAKINFVILDGSMGFHNAEKASAILEEALALSNKAAAMP